MTPSIEICVPSALSDTERFWHQRYEPDITRGGDHNLSQLFYGIFDFQNSMRLHGASHASYVFYRWRNNHYAYSAINGAHKWLLR
jgi:hypothetical protein